MSSLSELLTRPVVEATPRPITAPAAALDAFTRARIDEAVAEAYTRGRRDGAADARADAAAATQRVTAAVADAGAAVISELRELRAAAAEADTGLAVAIAEAVLGREPHDGGMALLARLRDALSALDDEALTVHAHPDDAALLADALDADARVTVTPDAGLAPGEARVTGRWAEAELTRAAAWAAVREVLDAPTDHGGDR